MKIEIIKGDITKLKVDAIVNPANSFLVMGGGLAGIIRSVGGEKIEEEATKHAPVAVGKAIITSGGKLPCKYVIHAPTMGKPAQKISTDNVKLTMEAILKCAEENNIKEIAIPGLGTGVGGVPYKEAAEVMLRILKNFKARNLKKVLLVAYNDNLYNEFLKAY
jgi:O-acetyl-ADP-ribose deacetylase (regulator of RNase III)